MFKRLLIYGAFLSTALGLAQETEDEINPLEEVVVIDSKFKIKRENSGKVTTRITSEEIQNSRGLSIPEVINSVSGIEINGTRSNDGQNLGYYIRGGRNRQVVIMVDGIQLSDPSSIANDFDLRLLPLAMVESIEIIKGASSTLYGSGAATAVININTKDTGIEDISLTVQSTLSTNQNQKNQDYNIARFDNAIVVSGRNSGFNYQLSYSNRYSGNMSAVESPEADGSFEENPFGKNNVYARLGYKFSNKLNVYFYGNYDSFNSSFDDAFLYSDADNQLESKQVRAGSHWEYNYGSGSVIFNDSYSELEREIKSDFPTKFDSKVYAFDAYNKYIINKKFHTLIGVNGIFSSFNSYSIPFGQQNFEISVNDENANFQVVDPYLNLVYVSGTGFNLNTGARLNIHSEYGQNLIYSINPSYTTSVSKGTFKVLTSFSTAYITPSLYQLFDPNYGNENLNPEESSTVEGGFEYQSKLFTFSSVYFRRNSENFIDFVTIDPVNFLSEYQNISEEFIASGVEVELDLNLSEKINLRGNYTFTEADEKFALRIPKHKLNAQLGYRINKNTFTSLNYQFNDERTDSFYNNETFINELVVLEEFGILDYFISHRLNENVELFAGVSNITNEEYSEIYRFNTQGRNVRAGVTFNF